MQLLKYNSKFNFNTIFIANRTVERAIKVCREHQCKTYEWSKVLKNDFEDFDVIISAASNCHHLIKKMKSTSQKLLLIDLALPSNINHKLAQEKRILFYDLDTISVEMEDTKEKRLAAISKVGTIIDEELLTFINWRQGAQLRVFLNEYKSKVNQKVLDYFEAESEEYDLQVVKTVTDRVVRKSIKQTKEVMDFEDMDALIAEQASYL
jgi:glutamyl-tRNA reductase